MTAVPSIESRCRELGGEVFERAHAARPRVWHAGWWQQGAMDMSLAYDALRVQLFRFIDVLPVLHSDEAIARHLKEYLDPECRDMPAAGRLAMSYSDPGSPHARLIARLTRRVARHMAAGFIAGGNAGEAVRFVQHLRRRRLAFTLDVLGEFTSSHAQADRYQRTYLDLMHELCPAARHWEFDALIDRGSTGPMPRVNVSVKLTGLSPSFDAIDPASAMRSVCHRLRPILRRARDVGAFVNVDMESYAYHDLTLDLFMRVFEEAEFREMTDVGIVIQAYLRSAESHFERLLSWIRRRGHGIAVRLVKGAYWDTETAVAAQNNSTPPVWLDKWRSDACYERIARRMLENRRWLRPAFATHNVRTMASVMAAAEQLGADATEYEFQLLNGMGEPLKDALADMGRCVRVYTPYGDLVSGMGYLIRRLLENTANDSFLRQSHRARDIDRLLMNPAEVRAPSRPPRGPRFQDVREDEPMFPFRNEPSTSFAIAANRERFAEALQNVRDRFGREYPLCIEGRAVTTEAWIESVNPSRPGEVVGRAAAATPADADHAVAAAVRAFRGWRLVDAQGRAGYLHRAADALRRRRFEFAALITHEAGKPWREADADVAEAIDYLDYYAYLAERQILRPRRRDLPGEDNHLVYEPKGVCVVLSTWTFPLALLANMTAAALAAGNTVIMKPASAAPVVAAWFMDVFRDLDLPPGVLNYLPGDGRSIGRHLVRSPHVNLVAVTGSRDVGVEIMRAAPEAPTSQQHLKRVVAEMGGKNAIIVDDDADLDEAVAGVIKSSFGYSGQKCTACSRAVVLTEAYDAFCGRLVDAASAVVIGPADDPATVFGPLIDEHAVDRVRRYIEIGRTEGRFLLERTDVPAGGFFVGPVIIADADPSAIIAQEEILGPVLTVLLARDFDHALEIANGTRYALTGGLYSRSPAHMEMAKREFLVGNLYINRKITGSRVDIEPFGGIKMSGDGAKAGGPEYLHGFCNARTITEHTLRHGLSPARELQTTA